MNKSPNTNEAEAQVGTSSTQNEATKAKTSKTSPFSSSTSRSVVAPWMRLNNKDPRIVRVSRAFGGKDRHSKVCTVRGLRDRRVRLSVPTAIQLYDLQDRLGLNQPSKVVDWLIDAAKDDIDELPPLPMMPPPPGSYSGLMNHHHSLMNMTSDQSIIGANIWRPANEESQENKDGEDEDDHGKERSNVLMTRTSSSSATNTNHPLLFSGLVNNSNAMASYNFNNWDQSRSSSFPLPHQVGGHGFTPHNFNAAVLPSALSLATGTTQPYFPSSNATTTEAADQNIYIGRRFEHHIHSSSHHHQDFLARSLYHPSSQQRNAMPQNLMGMITSKISETNNDHEHPSSR